MNELIKEALKRGPACPPLETLAFALTLNDNDSRKADASRHIAGCPCCRADYLLQCDFQNIVSLPEEEDVLHSIAHSLGDPVPRPGVPRPIPIRAARQRWFQTPRVLTGIAAAAVLSVVAIGVREHRVESLDPAVSGSATYRSAAVQAVFPIGDLQQTPSDFHWTATPDAHSFVLTVMEVDRTVVYSTWVRGTNLAMPSEVRTSLQPGRTLLWTVKALDADGTVFQESKIERFRLAGRP
jgi:hypothetical protein